MQPIIQATGISRSFGQGNSRVRALVSVDFEAAAGEFIAIMGPSGSGKSTLLAILGGLDTPDAGEVRINGRNIGDMREEDLATLRLASVGFVFQAYNLISVLTAQENVALPLLLAGRRPDEAEQKATEALRQVGLEHRLTHAPSELSGGEQQRVAIARALVTNPAVILADEPTGNLDSHASRDVIQTLSRAARNLQQTVVLVSHDAAVASWADRVLFMRDGEFVDECVLDKTETGSAERLATIMAAYERTRHKEAS